MDDMGTLVVAMYATIVSIGVVSGAALKVWLNERQAKRSIAAKAAKQKRLAFDTWLKELQEPKKSLPPPTDPEPDPPIDVGPPIDEEDSRVHCDSCRTSWYNRHSMLSGQEACPYCRRKLTPGPGHWRSQFTKCVCLFCVKNRTKENKGD